MIQFLTRTVLIQSSIQIEVMLYNIQRITIFTINLGIAECLSEYYTLSEDFHPFHSMESALLYILTNSPRPIVSML